ncbi:ferrioxamine B transporter [Sporothrix curviconia]|uniref:Ferrioxamine B transporter n=1 Tax=Sporothrix curviconia TaxID=1260050 RepID=A0ABP0C3E4_9PEZI
MPKFTGQGQFTTSPGVYRIEVISLCLTNVERAILLGSIFLLAYSYGLDNAVRNTYETYALSSFAEHSLQSTVRVIQTVIGAAAQPTAAKLADVFGRLELLCVALGFYVVGTIIEAVATDVATYSGGSVLFTIGYTIIAFLLGILIADVTSTRSRVLFSYLPALPYVINTWVGGNITSAVIGHTSWKWGIGMWALITPVLASPLIVSLLVVSRRARQMGLFDEAETAVPRRGAAGAARLAYDLFWLLDVVGLVLLIAMLGLILVPFTLAGGIHTQWAQAHIIVPLAVGVACIPAFVVWELRTPHPLLPFALIKDRSVWAPIGIAIFLDFTYVLPADYLFTVLQVAFDFSITAATRITTLYSFASIVVGPFVGIAIYKLRRLKIFVVAGTLLYLVAFGLMIRYRGSALGDGRSGIIGAQVLLGLAGGIYPYAAQASMQINLRHEHLAAVTGVEKAAGWIGSALGNTVSGALWTQLLPGRLEADLAPINNATLAALAYADPLDNIVPVYPLGTPERTAVIHAYQYIQLILVVTGMCLCVPLVVFAAVLRDQKLTGDQTLVEDDTPVRHAKDIELTQPQPEPAEAVAELAQAPRTATVDVQ